LKYAVSNIALPAYDHADDFGVLADIGLSGLEVAPSRVWRDTWHGVTAVEVNDYRRRAERAGLRIVGLHSLLFDQPDLALFGDTETRHRTLDYMTHLSAVCRDLGGRTLIWGAGRKRGALASEDAVLQTVTFFHDLHPRISDHGTCFCLEPLGPEDTDFVNSVHESVRIVQITKRPSLGVQIDAKALAQNAEANEETFRAAKPHLVHYHANEPGFGSIGSSGTVDHAKMGDFLAAIGYDGFVSIEQRMLNNTDPLADIRSSLEYVKECYR